MVPAPFIETNPGHAGEGWRPGFTRGSRRGGAQLQNRRNMRPVPGWPEVTLTAKRRIGGAPGATGARLPGARNLPAYPLRPSRRCQLSIDGDGGQLLPSVIFRRVTNGFRSEWGAKVYADLCSIVATARLAGRSALAAIRDALADPATERTAA
jgi:hypothetical protein